MTIVRLKGDFKVEFVRLWDYLEEIKRNNLVSTTEMKVYKPMPSELHVFERLYISFGCFKKRLLGGCRKILWLNGSLLKG